MFEEMKAQGSNIPNKVEYLQSHGWQSYKHHDNWVRKDLKDWEKDLCNFDLNSAYEEALREANELSNAVRVLCNALREDEKNVYNLWRDQIQSHVFDEFRKFGEDKPVNGLYEKDITLSYKDVSELCFNGAKNFLNLLIDKK